MSTLSANALAKSFRAASGQELPILVEASLDLDPGQNLAVVGPSGSGKSTLLSILGTLDHPTSGSYQLLDTKPFELSEPQLARFRNRQIGFVFQDHHLLPQCTVLENALVPFLATGAAGPQEIEQATKLLERVGLGERLLHRPAQLSGGERQRAAMARALVRRPGLVLADEPTGNLDAATARQITELLLELQAEQDSMLIVVTHSSELAHSMQRRLQLVEGKLTETS